MYHCVYQTKNSDLSREYFAVGYSIFVYTWQHFQSRALYDWSNFVESSGSFGLVLQLSSTTLEGSKANVKLWKCFYHLRFTNKFPKCSREISVYQIDTTMWETMMETKLYPRFFATNVFIARINTDDKHYSQKAQCNIGKVLSLRVDVSQKVKQYLQASLCSDIYKGFAKGADQHSCNKDETHRNCWETVWREDIPHRVQAWSHKNYVMRVKKKHSHRIESKPSGKHSHRNPKIPKSRGRFSCREAFNEFFYCKVSLPVDTLISQP